MGLRPRPTIYIPFPQALPNVPVIDRENCVALQERRAAASAPRCARRRPSTTGRRTQVVRVEAGAVILAPGFCLYDPAQKPEYSYGPSPNVVSSLQFERILSASGPYLGKVLRPSDGKAPKRIAFIQCVGSRDEAHDYCSSVCCMYAIKEAIIAREHEHDLECTLFYMDVRAHGKGFDVYYERAKEMGIRFIRCRPSRIDELESKSLRVGFVPEDDGGADGRGGSARVDGRPRRYQTEDFDLVVLASGLEPPAEARELADQFGIELDAHGFGASPAFDPVATSRAGVFVAGPFAEPKDIPETVVEASSAAARGHGACSPSARGTLVTKEELPPETDVAGRGAAHRRVRLPLRHEHRRRAWTCPRCPSTRGRCRRGVRHGQPLHLLVRHAGIDQGEDRGAPPEPRGRGLLLAAHARAAVPGDHPRGGAEPAPVRDGQHPRPVLVGAHATTSARPPRRPRTWCAWPWPRRG